MKAKLLEKVLNAFEESSVQDERSKKLLEDTRVVAKKPPPMGRPDEVEEKAAPGATQSRIPS